MEDPTFLNFFKDAQVNFAGKSFGADLTVVVLTFFVFYIPDAIKLKIKFWWVLIPLTFIIAVVFTFPLYLYMKENTMKKLKDTA